MGGWIFHENGILISHIEIHRISVGEENTLCIVLNFKETISPVQDTGIK